MRFRITFTDGSFCDVWAEDVNEACRKGKMLGDVARVSCDYSSIFDFTKKILGV